jgi:hypothetical protein
MAGHSRDTSLQPPPQGSIKLHLKGTSGVPASSYPIKGRQGLYKGANDEQQMMKNQSPSHHRRSISQAISFVLSLFL